MEHMGTIIKWIAMTRLAIGYNYNIIWLIEALPFLSALAW